MAKCLSSSYNKYQAPTQEVDPLAAAGRGQRKQIFSSMDASRPGQEADTQRTLDYLHSAASNPGFANAANLANREINGDYLHGSPELDAQIGQMRSAAGRESSNAAAGVRDQFSRNGLSFGTGNAQAQQVAKAAGTAQANQTEAGMRMQNYGNERAIQNAGVGVLNAATAAPLSYLSQTSAARYQPLAAQAGIVQQLAGGNTMFATPQDVVEEKGLGDQAAAGMGSM